MEKVFSQTSADGSKQGSEQQKVIVRFFGRHGELHGAIDNLVQVRLKIEKAIINLGGLRFVCGAVVKRACS